jgi:hypothetical protein
MQNAECKVQSDLMDTLLSLRLKSGGANAD